MFWLPRSTSANISGATVPQLQYPGHDHKGVQQLPNARIPGNQTELCGESVSIQWIELNGISFFCEIGFLVVVRSCYGFGSGRLGLVRVAVALLQGEVGKKGCQ